MRSRFADLALEAVMVVFAVLIALGVEEWREERQLREFAGRARDAVVAEMRANLEEYHGAAASLDSVRNVLAEVVEKGDASLLEGDLSITLPEASSAAWRAAQASQASAFLDYDWVIRVSRAYEVTATYQRIAETLIDDMGVLIGSGPSEETLAIILGRLTILIGVHGQASERLENVLAEEDDEP